MSTETLSGPVMEIDESAFALSTEVVSDVIAGQGISSGFDVCDPATGSVIATLADQSAQDALVAVERATRAGELWARTSTRQRADLLREWYDLLIANAERIAVLITREMGKPLAEARGEVAYGTDFVRWYAEEAVRPAGNNREVPTGVGQILTRRAPVGLSVLITPWNFPLAMATRKIAPALAAGCPTVIKPAALTPLTTIYAAQLAHQAGVPEGLINVVTTTSASAFSDAVLRDSRVRKVSFTGSTPVGRTLLGLASHNVLRSSMELGGNAPLIVFDDADLERAVAGALSAKMRNSGQSCIAANRMFVQDGIYDDFVEKFTVAMRSVVVGSGFAPGVGLGPLIDDRAVASMAGLVADAVGRGATLATGGSVISSSGSFFEPTVLVDVPADAHVATTEIFGPIAAVQRFTTEDEVLARANDTEFGLAGYVFTESLDRALNVADRLETGLVGINQGVPSNAAAPFGG